MERPKRCYIRYEWFEAISYLPAADRCQFYEQCIQYAEGGIISANLTPAVRAAFMMVKPILDVDVRSYGVKVVANRQNGSSGGRPRIDVTQKNPNKPKQTQTAQHIHRHIQDEKEVLQTSFSLENWGKVEREIFLELWKRGCYNAGAETERLIAYYEARGWVDKGGNHIVKYGALAKVWKVDPASLSPYYERVRKRWCRFIESIDGEWERCLCDDFQRLQIKGDLLTIFCRSGDFSRLIEDKYLQQLRMFVKVNKIKDVEYVARDQSAIDSDERNMVVTE